ncbi:hypothetical protein SEA_SUCHA_8 [Microbacterium phage Sucha]|nr:hypothetical protein SEA_SUCHA_8 [Microbacterium phage Sucha]
MNGPMSHSTAIAVQVPVNATRTQINEALDQATRARNAEIMYGTGSPEHTKASKPATICAHGCGESTKGGRYLPGHDAKHVANLFADIKYSAKPVKEALAELPTPALHNKLVNKLHREGWTFDAEARTWTAPSA